MELSIRDRKETRKFDSDTYLYPRMLFNANLIDIFTTWKIMVPIRVRNLNAEKGKSAVHHDRRH